MTHSPYLPALYGQHPVYIPADPGQDTNHTSGEAWDLRSDVAFQGSLPNSYRDHDAVPSLSLETHHHVTSSENAERLEHQQRSSQTDELKYGRERATIDYVEEHRKPHKRRNNYARRPKRESRRHKTEIKKTIDEAQGRMGIQNQHQEHGTQQYGTQQYYDLPQYGPQQQSPQYRQQHSSFPATSWSSR